MHFGAFLTSSTIGTLHIDILILGEIKILFFSFLHGRVIDHNFFREKLNLDRCFIKMLFTIYRCSICLPVKSLFMKVTSIAIVIVPISKIKQL